MKNYTITVNGNVYNVTVEEGTTNGVIQAAVPKAAAPVPAAPKAEKADGGPGPPGGGPGPERGGGAPRSGPASGLDAPPPVPGQLAFDL